jgi:hypothetical protein
LVALLGAGLFVLAPDTRSATTDTLARVRVAPTPVNWRADPVLTGLAPIAERTLAFDEDRAPVWTRGLAITPETAAFAPASGPVLCLLDAPRSLTQ